MHWTYHIHIQNDMDISIHGLNLLAVWEQLEPGTKDVIDLDPGESFEFRCNDPTPYFVRRKFKAALENTEGIYPEVWYCNVSDILTEE